MCQAKPNLWTYCTLYKICQNSFFQKQVFFENFPTHPFTLKDWFQVLQQNYNTHILKLADKQAIKSICVTCFHGLTFAALYYTSLNQ